MTVEQLEASGEVPNDLSHRNDVVLVGKITSALTKRSMPSGDVVGLFRVTVDRGTRTRNGRKMKAIDVIDCAVWPPKLRKKVETWAVGDVIELSGWLRRRFYRTALGVTSRYEVEVRETRWLGRTETKPAKSKSSPKKQAIAKPRAA